MSNLEIKQKLFKRPKTRLQINFKNKIDGLKLMQKLLPNTIKTCFFDPQYRGLLEKMQYGNAGVDRWKKQLQLPQMTKMLIRRFIRQISRVLQPSAHLFLWIDKFHLCNGVSSWFSGNKELKIVDLIVWNKNKMGMGYRTRRTSEYLLVLQKSPLAAKKVWKDRSIRDIFTEKVEKRTHVHQKPFRLQELLLKAVSDENDFILDPAAGSFVLLDICKKNNRHFIGGDLVVSNENS